MKTLAIFIFSTFIVLFAAYLFAYLECRISALFGRTFYPKGRKGLLLPVSNVVKMLSKVNYRQNTFKDFIIPIIAIIPIITAFCLIFSSTEAQKNILIILTLVSISFISMFFAIFLNKKTLTKIGSMQLAMQTLNLQIPLILSVFTAAILAKSLDINEIIQAQAGLHGLFGWFFIPGILSCIVFFICILIFINNVSNPKNLLYNEVLDHTEECCGAKAALLLLSKNALLFMGALLITFLFFGGDLNPLGTWFLPKSVIFIEKFFWLTLKVLIIITTLFTAKEILVKPHCKRVLEFAQNILWPLSLINLIVALIVQYSIGLKF